MKGLILFLIAASLAIFLLPLGALYTFVILLFSFKFKAIFKRISEYFLSIAIAIDQMGNVVMQELFNHVLIKKYEEKKGAYNYALFGNPDETISSVLGKNYKQGTLTFLGKALNWILNIFEKNHSIKSIEETK